MDNHGYVLAPLTVRSVNHHDTVLFPESFHALIDLADLFHFDLMGAALTLDAGFDSVVNHELIRSYGLEPVIKPNRRGTKDAEKIQQRLETFRDDLYTERYKVERVFAWQDTYRKLVIRYERLQCIHLGFKYVAYTLMNLRGLLRSRRNSL